MSQLDPVISIAILLGAAVVGGMIAHRLRQPVILGYLVVGVALGPQALGFVGDPILVETMATMGVALLMFTLGLEVSISQLRQVGKVGLWGGVAQILVTFVLGLVVGVTLLNWSLSQAVLLGLVISLSSTMVCLKTLMDRGELDSVHGRIMLAILILQDLIVVLMVIVLPLLGGTMENLPLALATAVGKVALLVGAAIVAGLWVLPWLMGKISGVRSRELLLLTVLVLCLGAAIGTYILGLSAVFGAFVIGLVLRESRFGHQALAEITPLRDIFATLFFISLGMLISPRFLIEQWASVAVLVAIIIGIKFLVVFGIVRFFGFSGRIAFLTGGGLFQIGEFSFILAQGGMSMGIISEQLYSLILASAIITMILTPLSMSFTSWLYPKLVRAPAGAAAGDIPALPPSYLSEPNPVVIAGYGRVGENIAQGLKEAGISYLVIEIDPELISTLRYKGIICIYGDATNAHVLGKVNLEKAKVLVITFPDPIAVMTATQAALRINPKLKIVARAHRAREVKSLKRLGVKEIVSPEYEASLEFLQKILSVSGWRKADVRRTLAAFRQAKETAEFSTDEEE